MAPPVCSSFSAKLCEFRSTAWHFKVPADSAFISQFPAEQKEAEAWLIEHFSIKLGIKLKKRRFPLEGGGWIEVDGFCESPLILCEAWAHIGPPKSAQKSKVMTDAFKLLFVLDLIGGIGKSILLFSDYEAAAHFQGRSWMAQCLKRNDIRIEVIELPPEFRTRVLAA